MRGNFTQCDWSRLHDKISQKLKNNSFLKRITFGLKSDSILKKESIANKKVQETGTWERYTFAVLELIQLMELI